MNRENRREVPIPSDGFILPWLFNGATILPMRSFSDFLLNFSQYQLPLINGLGSFKDQVVNNLLYYQTNYFSIFVTFLLVVGFTNYKETVEGIVILLAVWFIIIMIKPLCNKCIRRNNVFRRLLNFKLVRCILGLVLFYIVGTNDDTCASIVGCVLLSSILTGIHAILRRQNIENQLFIELGSIRLSYTLMGILLERLFFIKFQVYRPRYQR